MTDTRKPIPVMLTGQALTSLRDSGFNFPAAVAELIDNSIEAGSNNIHLYIHEAPKGRKKVVDEIVVVDDGRGMDDHTLQHYMQFGFSSRFMSTTTIGKFGVGAKLAGLSVGLRIEAWSRTTDSDEIHHVYFDLHDANAAEERGGEASILPPDLEPLPAHLQTYFPEGPGTLVCWSKIDPDRVVNEHGQSAPNLVRTEVMTELARIFREFISGGIKVTVDGTPLLAHDPTFMRKGTWADQVLREDAERRGNPVEAEAHFEPTVFHDEFVPIPGTDQFVRVVITLAPRTAIRIKGRGGDELATRLRIPDNLGAISFMRFDREISYTNVAKLFPRGVQDPDRYIGFEVHFKPELDRMMGVRNVKRGVVPNEALRTKLRELAKIWIPKARTELDRIWGEMDREDSKDRREHELVVKALSEAERSMPKSRVKDVPTEQEEQTEWEDLAHDVGKDTEEEKAAYIEEVKALPFVVESVNIPGDQLMLITHLKSQTIVRLNKRHRFYREMYEPLRLLTDEANQNGNPRVAGTARRAVEAITLLLVAYAKAESQHETPEEQFSELRTWWGMFTDRYLSRIKDVL
ncbi:ATP-binding protein [Kitasatospora sp. NPDC101183]|uniref:ATP-binding protein n=1 Tax=Kitasatospora sp. NPDC101183 TaxID=3364100 RepID=UPI003825CF0E